MGNKILNFNAGWTQLKLPLVEIPVKKKRIRPPVPTFVKFYPLYQYDRLKFRVLLNEWLNSDEGRNRTKKTLIKKQNDILEQCYIRDENGKIRYSDEKHIFRFSSLHNEINGIHEQIYRLSKLAPISSRTEIFGLVLYAEDKQAEIVNSWNLPVKTRVLLHLELLRNLRKGYGVQEAIDRAKSRILKGLQ